MMYDNQAVERARNADMVAFLKQYAGFTFSIKGSEYRCKEHPSLSVKIDRLTWYWHSRSVGGRGVLDFLIKAMGMNFRDAMTKLESEIVTLPSTQIERLAHTTLILPEKASFLYKRLYAYLNQTRGIDASIIAALIQEKKIYEDKRGNIVFVGYDENNIPRFASLRGTYTNNPFRMDCPGSDKRYGFNMSYNASEQLYVFESPIDAMSHASLEITDTDDRNAWKRHNRLSLAGTSDTALKFFLKNHAGIKELSFCLDNDSAGCEATASLTRKYNDCGYRTRIELPKNKDFNEDLMTYRLEKTRQKHTNNQQAYYAPER